MAELLREPNACPKVFYNSPPPVKTRRRGKREISTAGMKFENLKLISRICVAILSARCQASSMSSLNIMKTRITCSYRDLFSFFRYY